jgi:putative endonuclease
MGSQAAKYQAPGTGHQLGNRAAGRFGEDLAARWYEAQGFRVVGRNWRCSLGELDIVARKGNLVVFCEVKARSAARYGLPAEAVGPLKQLRARKLAAAWFAAQQASGCAARRGGPVRFDVAAVVSGKLEVIEGAF